MASWLVLFVVNVMSAGLNTFVFLSEKTRNPTSGALAVVSALLALLCLAQLGALL